MTLATEYDGASLLGWIRNNTDRIAFLGGAELGLQMRIVEWTMDGFNRYTRKVMDNIVPEYRPYTTCAIFPGETGIVALSLRCAEKDGCTIAEETSANPPPELGTVLEYSSRLQPIPEDWDTADRHPAAEAYGLLRKEDFLFFRFAMASINEDYSYLRYRIVLLDAEGTLLNVASDDKYLHSPYAPATTTTIGWIGKNNYFLAPQVVGSRVESFLPTTREMLDRVDHTEVFLEYSDGCIS